MESSAGPTSAWSVNTSYDVGNITYSKDEPMYLINKSVLSAQKIPSVDVHDVIFTYVAPVLILMGTIGNIISVVVLQGRFFRRAPSVFILSALSLTDTGVLLCGLMRHWIKALTQNKLNIRNLSQASCPIHFFFTYFLSHLSSWSLALLTVERMSSVRWPFKAK
ncbi:hypothetical protein LSH36_316g02010 [Paralvinella palmiformis]|uniref:G-protein coupled receptors family 1 profile domain-containing protein n=1 Tax=Paralvinella palmiformis TaxID=53620 RepID=A0AAD9JIM5_9ANNE|nr:hypothetical protein LSH36_316g02010 [Paralvinella palmiformis]